MTFSEFKHLYLHIHFCIYLPMTDCIFQRRHNNTTCCSRTLPFSYKNVEPNSPLVDSEWDCDLLITNRMWWK